MGWPWRQNAQPYATVIQSVGAVELRDGTELGDGRYVLQAGFIELLTPRGARLAIEAPAEFHFVSVQELWLQRGRVSAEIAPAAKGFTVLTPSGKAIDLGTRFGVDVSADGVAEVHVYQGEVVAQSKGSEQQQLLTTNSAVRLGQQQSRESCDVRIGSFLQSGEVQQLAAGFQAGQPERSRKASELLRNDPSLLAWIDFEDRANDESFRHSARVIGPRSVQGRFAGTTAADFIDRTDRVELNLNVRVRQFTLLTWVRLNGVDHNNNSLYSTDEWGRLGQVHWMTGRHGKIRFAIKSDVYQGKRPEGGDEYNIRTETPAILSERVNRWSNLGLVYDSIAGRLSIYVDGRCETSMSMPHDLIAALGSAQIGNWKPLAHFSEAEADRRLRGRMDEFGAFSRAFSPAEIEAYYESTTPYR